MGNRRNCNRSSYVTKTRDFAVSNFPVGTTIELWIHRGGDSTVYARNFRLKYILGEGADVS